MMTGEKYIILFDGVCNFCNFWINFLLQRDKDQRFLFSALQSVSGQQYLQKFNLNQTHFDTFIVIRNNRYFTKSDAALLIARNLPAPYKYLNFFKIIPKKIRDWVYSRIAANRYKMFGKKDICRIPAPHERNRFLP